MNNTATNTIGALAMVAAMGVSLSAHAVTYNFSDSQSKTFADMAVASLKIEDITGGTQWTLTGLFDSTKYSSAFIHKIEFNYAGVNSKGKPLPLVESNLQVLSGDIGVKKWDNGVVSFNASNNATRFVSGDSLRWVYQNTRSNQFSDLMAHVNSINSGNSVKFAAVPVQISPVPEPSTWMMFGLGLVGLVALARRRSTSASLSPAPPA